MRSVRRRDKSKEYLTSSTQLGGSRGTRLIRCRYIQGYRLTSYICARRENSQLLYSGLYDTVLVWHYAGVVQRARCDRRRILAGVASTTTSHDVLDLAWVAVLRHEAERYIGLLSIVSEELGFAGFIPGATGDV